MTAPSIFHQEIGTITITSDLSFKAAKVVWDAIAEKYSNDSLDKQIVKVIEDPREENAARSVIPSHELPKPTAQQILKKLSPKEKRSLSQSRAGVPGWTPDEINLISVCPDVEEAWVAYQKVYPDRRNRNAIKQKFRKLTGKGDPPAKSTKQRGRSLKCPYCDHVTLSQGIHRHAKYHHPKEYVVEDVVAYIAGTTKTSSKSTNLVVAPTEEKPENPKKERVTPPGQKAIRDLVVAKNGTITPGQHVKHNGSSASPFFGKVGEVLKVSADNQLFVKFDTSTTWLPHYLVLVMPEVAPA